MKTTLKTLFLSVISLFAFSSAEDARIPITPLGLMTATPTNVRIGTFPTLSWSISHPKKISDVATIIPPASIMLESPMYVSVQIIGSKVTACSTPQKDLYTETKLSINGGSYVQLFYGDQSNVDSSFSLYIKRLGSKSVINFGGRYSDGTSWGDFYTSKSSNFQIIALKNGETVPSLQKSGDTVPKHLAPYVDSLNRVKIGPMSVLILMELGEKNHLSSCFDYSDQVLLVSFSNKHPNNGHGNNLDGVDSSNPSNGSGGPNAGFDASAGVDDEK